MKASVVYPRPRVFLGAQLLLVILIKSVCVYQLVISIKIRFFFDLISRSRLMACKSVGNCSEYTFIHGLKFLVDFTFPELCSSNLLSGSSNSQHSID